MERSSEPANHVRIAAVERDTGLSKDTLRVWERRYGFPAPARDAQGERLYSPEDVDKLRLIRRLLDQGARPARLVREDVEALQRRLDEQAGAADTAFGADAQTHHDIDALLRLVALQHNTHLHHALQQRLLKQGLQSFVKDTVAPLNVAVGQAWLRGQLGVAEEHLYSEQLQNVLRNVIGSQHTPDGRPRILLTTVPGEQHGLGLLMVEAMLTPEGACCVSLGTQTPIDEIGLAASGSDFDIVALSFSLAFPLKQAVRQLHEIRARLPQHVTLWAGGAVFATRRNLSLPPGVHITHELDDTVAALHAWLEAMPQPRSAMQKPGP